MTANQVPSGISWRAATPALRAAAMRSPSIDPEVSMMMISPAAPWLPALPASVQVISTTAWTSLAPSDRYSFWKTALVKVATSGSWLVGDAAGGGRGRIGRGGGAGQAGGGDGD